VWEPRRFDYVNILSSHVWYTPLSPVKATDHEVIPAVGRRVWRGARSSWLYGFSWQQTGIRSSEGWTFPGDIS
jgi:hypothetical protein